ICTSVTLARASGILLIWRMCGCGNDGMRDSSSVSRCDRSIQGPLAPEIFGDGRSSQPFQPGILGVSVSHMARASLFIGLAYLVLRSTGPDSLPPTTTPAHSSIILIKAV